VPALGALGLGTLVAGLVGRRIYGHVDACRRCLRQIDMCKEAAVRAIRMNGAGDPSKATSQEPFTLLSGLEDALLDTFGSGSRYPRILQELGRFSGALVPADGFAESSAIAATVERDCNELTQARRDLRRVVLNAAAENPFFRMAGRHHAPPN
jgi:hypothetical protein